MRCEVDGSWAMYVRIFRHQQHHLSKCDRAPCCSAASASSSSQPSDAVPALGAAPGDGTLSAAGAAAVVGITCRGVAAADAAGRGAGVGDAALDDGPARDADDADPGAPRDRPRLDAAQPSEVSSVPLPAAEAGPAAVPAAAAAAAVSALSASTLSLSLSTLKKKSTHSRAEERTSVTASTQSGPTAGRMRPAASSAEWYRAVATIAWEEGSRGKRVEWVVGCAIA